MARYREITPKYVLKWPKKPKLNKRTLSTLSDPLGLNHFFHQLGPVFRVGLVVTESVCLCVVCPLPMRFFSRPLIGDVITWSVWGPSLVSLVFVAMQIKWPIMQNFKLLSGTLIKLGCKCANRIKNSICEKHSRSNPLASWSSGDSCLLIQPGKGGSWLEGGEALNQIPEVK